jgi:hypothetical protein
MKVLSDNFVIRSRCALSLLLVVTLVALALGVSSCQHTRPEAEVWDFGQPGVGKILVFIGGDVKHPGRYYLDDSANLDSVLTVFGGWGGQGDFGGAPPYKVTLSREQDGKMGQVVYRFRKMSASERQAVRLSDGDKLFFNVSIF